MQIWQLQTVKVWRLRGAGFPACRLLILPNGRLESLPTRLKCLFLMFSCLKYFFPLQSLLSLR